MAQTGARDLTQDCPRHLVFSNGSKQTDGADPRLLPYSYASPALCNGQLTPRDGNADSWPHPLEATPKWHTIICPRRLDDVFGWLQNPLQRKREVDDWGYTWSTTRQQRNKQTHILWGNTVLTSPADRVVERNEPNTANNHNLHLDEDTGTILEAQTTGTTRTGANIGPLYTAPATDDPYDATQQQTHPRLDRGGAVPRRKTSHALDLTMDPTGTATSGADQPELVTIRKWIGQSDFGRRSDRGEGNCLFYAMAHALSGRGIRRTHVQLRAETTRYIRDNAQDVIHAWDRRMPEAPATARPCRSMEVYLEAIAKRGAWGGEMELLSLSRLFPDYPILVIGPRVTPAIFADRDRQSPPIANRVALWLESGHYELITSGVPSWAWDTVWRARSSSNVRHDSAGSATPAIAAPLEEVPRKKVRFANLLPSSAVLDLSNSPASETHPPTTSLATHPPETQEDIKAFAAKLNPMPGAWWQAAPVGAVGSFMFVPSACSWNSPTELHLTLPTDDEDEALYGHPADPVHATLIGPQNMNLATYGAITVGPSPSPLRQKGQC